ncbi:MAG: alpha/beta fold hydrolase [Steroidobacteraceae bacterium]
MRITLLVRPLMAATLCVVANPAVAAPAGAAPAASPAPAAPATGYPPPVPGEFVARDFRFASGATLGELRLHYRTLGQPRRDAAGHVANAVLVLHGTGGSGAQFLRPEFAGELFRAGGVLDAAQYFIILPDGIGHGDSGKPSDGLHARFPHYGYRDMVEAQYRLVREGLGIDHLRLVMGTSMGGMHTWLWGELHPDFMDALMPLASLPMQISGRNRVWRRLIIDAIRGDPAWQGGEYRQQPPGLRVAEEMLFFMGSNPALRLAAMPDLARSDAVLDAAVAEGLRRDDANDVLYQLEASQDYDPGPSLEGIRAPLLAVNTADDLINPPELGVLEREIRRVPQGRAVLLPFGPGTRGHGSHTVARLWETELAALLARTLH